MVGNVKYALTPHPEEVHVLHRILKLMSCIEIESERMRFM